MTATITNAPSQSFQGRTPQQLLEDQTALAENGPFTRALSDQEQAYIYSKGWFNQFDHFYFCFVVEATNGMAFPVPLHHKAEAYLEEVGFKHLEKEELDA